MVETLPLSCGVREYMESEVSSRQIQADILSLETRAEVHWKEKEMAGNLYGWNGTMAS